LSSPDQDKVKVSLHLEPKVVDAIAFVRGVRAFIGLVEEVSLHFDRGLSWGVRVHEGSNVVEVRPAVAPEFGLLAMEALESIESGLELLEAKPELPPAFSTTAIKRAKRLADVIQQVGGHIQGPTRQCKLTSQASANADKLLGTPYSAIGSVEGELLLISDLGRPQIGIRDAITGRIIHCSFDSEDLDELATRFHKRISVRGYMKYRLDGSVSKIDVETYRVLRDSGSLPSADDVRGILREH
jgi:hypothetical protein